ncbi:filamentous hemagglutinin N-terminal domain-containing protein [Tolypothrix campylonemoides VB511288]|nr:filamentous hemagglutinin N-terminal domain-containing protein [Tolypothrix campylonemoides VB511288]
MFGMSTRWAWFIGITTALCANCAMVLIPFKAIAQIPITPDGTLPNNSIININGNTFNITGGTQAGTNLFHSFKDFSVTTGSEAFFNNTVDIANIISRVTGGSVSNIDGLIRTLGTANLFLINPSGIVFGRNASLNVGGSFVASTANAIQFGDIGFFSATNPEAPSPLLTINPSALVSNQIAARIQNSSIARAGLAPSGGNSSGLRVPDGRSLLLVGGNINMDGGSLNAFGGRVELGGLKEPGTVGLNFSGNNLSLSFPLNVALASVSLNNGAEVNVASGGGGSIAINASNIDVLGKSRMRAGIDLLAGGNNAQAGDIYLNAQETVNVENSSIYNAVFGSGNGGSVRIDTGKLIVQDGVIATTTVSGSPAGDLIVNAKTSVELTGSPSSNGLITNNIPISFFGVPVDIPRTPIGLSSASISPFEIVSISNVPSFLGSQLGSQLTGGGDGGNLTINTGRLIVSGGAQVSASTRTAGRGGNLTVKASDSIELTGTSAIDAQGAFTFANRIPSSLLNSTAGFGMGGELRIDTKRLIVRDGASMLTGRGETGLGGKMPGGNLIINASESVELSGSAEANGLPSTINSGTQGDGNAGNLTITTNQLRVKNGGFISAGTSSSGQGGELTINANELVELDGTSTKGGSTFALQQLVGGVGAGIVSNIVEERPFPSGLLTGSAGKGNAGNLTINTGRLSISGGAQASVSTFNTGNAGSLTVHASSVELKGASGQLSNLSDVQGRSLLTTAVGENSTGKGGDITVRTNSLTISDGAGLTASTSGQGNAGNISIEQANSVSISANGLISTAVNNPQAVGKGGNIRISADSVSVTNGGELQANTFGRGDAGNIEINANNSVNVSGTSSITGRSSGLFVRSQGLGSAGDIKVSAPEIRLDNTGRFIADSALGNGGNINLQVGNLLLLRRGSLISATAGTDQKGGDGGNITINARDGFVVAVPGENSDITANAFSGRGGQIEINASGLFGIQPSFKLTPNNDITASSERGISGKITINRPDVEQRLESVELSTVLADTSNIIDTSCAAFAKGEGNSFTVTGRGGLPPSPNEPLTTDVIWSDTRIPYITSQYRWEKATPKPPSKEKTVEIVPATGWVFDGKGNVTLISHASNANNLRSTPACQKR